MVTILLNIRIKLIFYIREKRYEEKDTKRWFMNLVLEKGIDNITTDDLEHLPNTIVGGTLIIEYKLKDGNSIMVGGLKGKEPGYITLEDKSNKKSTKLKWVRTDTDWDSLK